MTNPYRAMCAELSELDGHCVVDCTEEWADAMCRLRAALAQPEPVAPTDQEIEEWADACPEAPLEEMDPEVHGWRRCFTAKEFGKTIRAALARWGHPTPQPVAKRPTVMEIIELHSWLEDEWRANNDGEDLPTLDFARAVLAKWGRQ